MIETIKIKNELCTGCNRCVRECPMETANITWQDEGGNIKVRIDREKCITCGRCVTACKHGARYYADDLDKLFCDLRNGVPISLIAAPSVRTNIKDYKRLFTYLKRLGVNKIYDVSLGADICVWAHIRHLEKNVETKIITQPCPAIVSYCETYRRDLLKYLSPVHSPMACASIFMKKYEGVTDRIAALSPCIAKTIEFEATQTAQYNVTFSKLLEYLEQNDIELPEEESEFDHGESGLGSMFPMPGGLKENIEYFMGENIHVTTAEGFDVYAKLDKYAETPGDFLPDIYDVLNCAEGCNIGSACPGEGNVFEIDKTMNDGKRRATEQRRREYYKSAYKKYDETFDLSHFVREYRPTETMFPEITDEDIDRAFAALGKNDYEKQNVDCGACGSQTCHNMARKIAFNVNIPANCIFKTKEDAKTEHENNVLTHEQLSEMEKMHEADERMRAILNEANQRIKLMLDATPLSCILLNKDSKAIECNEEAVKLFKLKNKQEYMDHFQELSPEYQPDGRHSKTASEANIKEAFEKGRLTFEWMHQMRDGTPIPCEITLVRVDYEGEYVVVGFSRDLREHKQMMTEISNNAALLGSINNAANILLQSEIREFESNLQLSLKMIGEAVNSDRICIWKNSYINGKRSCTQICEWVADERLRTPRSIAVDVLYEDVMPLWEATMPRGDCINSLVRDLAPKDQKMMNMLGIKSVFAAPVFIRNDFWGFVGCDNCHEEIVFTDEVVATLRSGSLLITQALLRNEMTLELASAFKEARTANQAKSAFLATMSHEIRTPMNSIMGFAELAQDKTVSPDVKDYLGKITDSTHWLLHIVNDVLDISKIESGKMELENVPFDLHGIFQRCQSVIYPTVTEKGLDLHIYAEPPIGRRLLGDPVRLYQVLMNLLSNAVKFTSSGTVKMSSAITKIDDNAVTVYFEVKDSGIGMTAEQIDRVFEPFMQADSSTTRNYGGTGLGLPITKNIVELMGGEMTVESEPGKGSTFSFSVTFEAIEATDDTPEYTEISVIEKPAFDGLILICEDNPMNQQVIGEHLERVGFRTAIAENGKIGLEMVQERIQKGQPPFDLIFMDIFMPVMDGVEATSMINALDTGTPIVAMTANVMTSEMDNYRRCGMSDCVGKPFTTQELWRCLLKFLTPVSVSAEKETDQTRENEELQKKLRKKFVKDNQRKFAEIAKAITAGDMKLAHRLAHTLKGNAGQIGMSELQKAAAAIEGLLKEGTIPEKEKMDDLEKKVASVLDELGPLLDEPDEQTAAPYMDAGQARELLEKLEPMLESFNSECVDLLDEIRTVRGAGDLARQIEDYDFESAAGTLAGLKKGLEQI